MIDPRVALRANVAQWLRVRDNVRAIAARLAAAQDALRLDARGNGDAEIATLAAQMTAQRADIAALADELDTRIGKLECECAALDAAFIESIVSAARLQCENSGVGHRFPGL